MTVTIPQTETSSTAVVAAAVVGALACLAYFSTFFLLADASAREAVGSLILVTVNAVAALAFIVLAVQLAGAAFLAALPRQAVVLAAVGVGFVGALAWALATLGPVTADAMTDAQFDAAADSFGLILAHLPKQVFCLVGFLWLAIAGWRRGAFAKGACIVFGVAGIVSLIPPYPPGALLATVAVVWAARSPT
jgi:hypothetical protein